MDREIEEPEPIYGFVSRRKQFFASLENIADPDTLVVKKPVKTVCSSSGRDGEAGRKMKQSKVTRSQLMKWQSLPVLDQPGEDEGNRELADKKNKPHWTVLFQQRLNQIRHKFESRCKTEQSRGASSQGMSKSKANQASMSSLLAISQQNSLPGQDITKSCSDLYFASTTGRQIKTRPYQGKGCDKPKANKDTDRENFALRVKKVGPGIQAHLEAMIAQQRAKNPICRVTLHEEIPEKDVIMDHSKWFCEGYPKPQITYERSDGWFAGSNKEEVKQSHNGALVSPVPPVNVPSEGFTAEDKIKDRLTLRDWDPVSILSKTAQFTICTLSSYISLTLFLPDQAPKGFV